MLITRIGEYISKEFHFVCRNCNCEWYADRKEVNFTPPCFDYGVYMDCPCCNDTTYMKEVSEWTLYYAIYVNSLVMTVAFLKIIKLIDSKVLMSRLEVEDLEKILKSKKYSLHMIFAWNAMTSLKLCAKKIRRYKWD